MTRPRSGLISPTRDLRNTVLPVPEGPSMTLTSPGGRDSETSRQTTWCPKDFVSPSTTTSMPISPSCSNGSSCAAAQPVTECSGFGLGGGQVPPPPTRKHTGPCVSRLKLRLPEIAALKIGSRFSPTPQLLNFGISTMPSSGPPVTTLYGGLLALVPLNMASNGGVSQWDPTASGAPLTLTLPGTIRTDSRDDTVATVSHG